MQDVHVCVWGRGWGVSVCGCGCEQREIGLLAHCLWPRLQDMKELLGAHLTAAPCYPRLGKTAGLHRHEFSAVFGGQWYKKNPVLICVQCCNAVSLILEMTWAWQNTEWKVYFVNIQALLLNNYLEFLLCLCQISSYILTYIKIPCLHIMSYIMKQAHAKKKPSSLNSLQKRTLVPHE